MLCEICQAKEAVFHLRQVIGKEEIELHLCESCAKLKGIEKSEQRLDFSISQLLTGMVDSKILRKKPTFELEKCPHCGQSLQAIKKHGMLGCSQCYLVFQKAVREYLKRLYGRVTHKGKLPAKLKSLKASLQDINSLKEELKQALEAEDYELAASLRDRINEISARVDKHEAGN